MRFQIPNKSEDKRKLDMTPLIDCVFQLLLFFLVASHFEEQARMTNEGELEAALPEAAAAMPMTMKPQELIVNINAAGQFYIGGNLETEPALAQRLQQAQLNNPGNQSVVIRGDEAADWKYIARVMSLCNQANIRDYRVAVVKENEVSGGGL
jgi:biopolymer transport protein ExbD|tara:strand:- start:148 stop:603 length:456 start_codon:yes stop_codon:yes gene_type:complete